MKILAVRDWVNLYENSETRRRKQLGWVLTPNRHDSLAYCRLMNKGEEGCMIFGVWNVLLQLSSRGTEEVRGFFVDDSGNPYTIEDMSIKTRVPESALNTSIPILVELGWLCEVTSEEFVQGVRTMSATHTDALRTKIERKKGKKEKGEHGSDRTSFSALAEKLEEEING